MASFLLVLHEGVQDVLEKYKVTEGTPAALFSQHQQQTLPFKSWKLGKNSVHAAAEAVCDTPREVTDYVQPHPDQHVRQTLAHSL